VKKTRTTQKAAEPLPPEKLAPLVTLIRGERVLLDADLATLYGVQTKALNQACQRAVKTSQGWANENQPL
jgi:hypothetical protein